MNRIRRATNLLLPLLAALALPEVADAQSYANFEGKQTSPVRLSPDGTRLFAVNTPDDRLSVFDVSNPSNAILIAEIPVGLEPVSVNPLNNDEVWVVNEVSDSISIVSISRHIVTDTIVLTNSMSARTNVMDEPADVVFANGRAFVTVSRKNEVRVFDVTNHTLLATKKLFGEHPRALAVSPDGSKVYAAFALSGNRTTLIPFTNAPPQPTNGTPPMNPALSAPPQVGLIVDATDTNWTNIVKYTMPDNDVVELDASTFAVTRYFSRVGTVNLGLVVHPVSGDIYVANTDARNLVRFEPNVRGHLVDNRVSRVSFAGGVITHFDLNPGVDYGTLPNLPAKTNALAQPTAMVFDPNGNFLYVAAFGTDRIAKLDASGNILARIEIGPAIGSAVEPRTKRGPRGLALNANTQRLYVLNRISNTITIVDTSNDSVVGEIPIGSFDPTPAVIRQGRGFLYDAKLSGNGTAACAACHVDGEMDMVAWDLGNPQGNMETVVDNLGLPHQMHPMKGPMATQTLRGLSTLEPFHWRGDRTNFLHFNGAFNSLMGGPSLSAADMNAYRDFINTIVFQPNPNQNLDRSFPTNFAGGNAAAGLNTFTNESYTPGFRCINCHTLPAGSDRLLRSAGGGLEASQDFKAPHLRNLYQKLNFNKATGASSIGGFGLTHDGVEPDVVAFLSRAGFKTFSTNAIKKANLNAFVQCFDTGLAPAVGYTRTLTPLNIDTGSVSNDWTLLENQAIVTNLDLVVKGTLDGRLRGLVYQRASNNYRADKTGLGPFTRAQLGGKVRAGDTLSVMGVAPGTGTRLGIDRNEDGLLDGDVSAPLILQQPQDQIVVQGESATFTVRVSGTPPLGYQWRRGSTTYVPFGQGKATLTITNVQLSDANTYSVVITNLANASPGMLSSNALLTVLADSDGDHIPDNWESAHGFNINLASDATLDTDGDGMTNLQEYKAGTDPRDRESVLRLGRVMMDGNDVRIGFYGVQGKKYRLEWLEDVVAEVWTKVIDFKVGTVLNLDLIDTGAASRPNRIYRIVLLP